MAIEQMTIEQQKTFLYRSGWVWTGRHWFKKDATRPGKLLMVELPRLDAVEYESNVFRVAA
jgi:hypothetical protein